MSSRGGLPNILPSRNGEHTEKTRAERAAGGPRRYPKSIPATQQPAAQAAARVATLLNAASNIFPKVTFGRFARTRRGVLPRSGRRRRAIGRAQPNLAEIGSLSIKFGRFRRLDFPIRPDLSKVPRLVRAQTSPSEYFSGKCVASLQLAPGGLCGGVRVVFGYLVGPAAARSVCVGVSVLLVCIFRCMVPTKVIASQTSGKFFRSPS